VFPAPAAEGNREEEEEEDDDHDDATAHSSGYRSFQQRRRAEAKGVLYKIEPLRGDLRARITRYVQEGVIDQDLRFAREVFGLVNTSGRRDFDAFWESPWVEEHIRDTTRKRKRDEEQRNLAVRSYIRTMTTTTTTAATTAAEDAAAAPSAAAEGGVERFIDTVDRLTQWEDRHGSKDLVKTVSRTVQSFERAALSALLALLRTHHCNSYRARVQPLIDPVLLRRHRARGEEEEAVEPITAVACTLRRSEHTFHPFAAAVAMEMLWSEATSGARNTTIYMCKQIEERRKDANLRLIAQLATLTRDDDLPMDRLGVPLMGINTSLCISRGVLVVMPGSTSATYILDLAEGADDLANARTIRILRTVVAAGGAA